MTAVTYPVNSALSGKVDHGGVTRSGATRIAHRSLRSHRNPTAWLAGLLDATGAARVGRQWQCVVHGRSGNHAVSLSVGERKDGAGAWIYCHAGCDLRVLLDQLHLVRADLRDPPPVTPEQHAKAWRLPHVFPPPRPERHEGPLPGWVAREIVEHAYGDPAPVAWKVRERNAAGAKRLHWESTNPHDERVPGLLGRREAELPLYRIREVRMAIGARELVVLAESESSVDALCAAGIYATTWAGGASSPPLERLTADLGGAYTDVLLVPDNDDAGIACAQRIVRALPGARVQLGEPGEDARDVLARRGTRWFR